MRLFKFPWLIFLLLLITGLFSCRQPRQLARLPWPGKGEVITGSRFYELSAGMKQPQRDSLAMDAFFKGSTPAFLKKFKKVELHWKDSASGKTIEAIAWVSPDYFSVGTDADWARVPITPMSAQLIADTIQCFLPTPALVDAIHRQARVKLEPVPLYALRDSTPVFWHHHLIIEGQRKGREGLVAGIKKDVVISEKLMVRPGRVAIYGWHYLNGRPIQPVYAGHVDWYVDYSHGIRLIWQYLRVNGKLVHYTSILQDPVLKNLLTSESATPFRYPVTGK